ncbi:MAG TPA: DNA mismatch repair endonuclease MutL [Phycisphaerales bacterium]|nr:DNA mismatch repair endonuclease MutL [Phycisphaerales bacterium]
MDGGAATPSIPATAQRRPIAVLPTLVANQIAAGEVVERPASVVKELVENALDAGGTRITVELEQGGVELIRITDDGCGIPAGELHLALAPHATSKIRSSDELEAIATKGFRGEALASIASVSRMSIRSRTAGDDAAAEIECEGVTTGAVRPAGGPVGTVVTVRNLFFNTPARRKFLRTPATEQGRCVDVVKDLALAHPSIGFCVVSDGRKGFDVPANQSPRDRALAVLGEELADQMIEVSADSADRHGLGHAGAASLWGLVGLPTLARATAAAQHVALNGRIIRDKTIQHAIKEAYRGLIEPGRHPTAVLLIEIDPRSVDVNVHPAKTEVRFRDSSLLHSMVLRTIRDALQRADLTAGYAPPAARPPFGAGLMPTESGAASIQTNPSSAAAFAEAFKARFTAAASSNGQIQFAAENRGAAEESRSGGPRPEQGYTALDQARARVEPRPLMAGPPAVSVFSSPAAAPAVLLNIAPTTRPLQVHNSFLVTQDERGMVIIDQHALHERVMFEKLLDRVMGNAERAGVPLESQRLLMPAVIKADPRRLEALEACRTPGGLFHRIGLMAEQVGPDAIAVHAFPTFLFDRNVEVEPFVSELLDRAAAEAGGGGASGSGAGFAGGPSSEQALHEVLDMMACKAAIKAGNALSDHEVAELLAYRERTERAASCPHGRPTSVRLTIKDLERMFHRS